MACKADGPYLVLTHAVTWVENDPLAHQHVVVYRVVVEAVVGLAPVFQLAKSSQTNK